MGTFSTAEKNAKLDARWGSGTPATRYFALFDGVPGAGGTEVTGGSYARVAVTNNSTNFPAASGGAKANGTTVSFPTPTADWGDVTHVAVMSASSGGTVDAVDALPATRTIVTGDPVTIQPGQFTLTLSDPA